MQEKFINNIYFNIYYNNIDSILFIYNDQELIIVSTYQNTFNTVAFELDETSFRKNTRLYYRHLLYYGNGLSYEHSAQGYTETSTHYIEFDMTIEEFLKEIQELTPRDIDWLSREIR